jgi:hypothetical protein
MSSTANRLTDIVTGLKNEIEVLPSKLSELEDVQNKVNDGYSYSYDEIQKLKDTYPELESAIYRTADGWGIEKDAVDILYNSLGDLSTQFQSAEALMTDFLVSETSKRLSAYGIEIKTLQDLANFRAGQEMAYQTELGIGHQSLATMNPDLWAELQAYQDAYSSITDLQSQLTDITGGKVSGSSGNKTSSKTGSSNTQDTWLDAFNNEKSALDHKREMDVYIDDESVYYDKLEALNKKYFNNRKKYQEQYWQYEEEVYQGRKQLDEKAEQARIQGIKDGFDKVNDSISEYDKTMSEIDHYGSLVDDGSIESISLLQTGYEQAVLKSKTLNKEIDKLNKQYAKGKIPQDLYTEQLENLTNQLFDASSAMQTYKDAIVSAMKSRYDEQTETIKQAQEDELNALEKNHDATIDALNEQLNKRKEIIDAQKEELRVAQQKRQYEKEIAEQTDNISDIESRIAEVNKAALSGDRNAQAEKEKLEEELADAKTKLDDTQYDHQIDLAEDALDKSYSEYESMINKQINSMNLFYDAEKIRIEDSYQTRLNYIENLYANEMQLIQEAADLTKNSMTESYEAISKIASNNGISVSSSFTDAFTGINSGAISSILSNANGKGLGTSDLNKYVMSKGYGVLSYQNMVDLANALGLSGFTVDKVKSEKEQKKILEALKGAGFSTGGEVIAKPNRLIRLLTGGDDALAAVSDGEQIFTKKGSNTLESLLNTVAPKLESLFKFNTPTVSNLVTNNSSSPQIIFNLNGSYTEAAKPVLNNWTQDISKEIMNILRKS